MRTKILVVDDEAHIVQVLSHKLGSAGYDVLTARDGEEAFEIACRNNPALIVADFQMPYMTGLELCAALAQNQPTAEIPVIIITARGYALGHQDLALGNIKEVLSKPFSPRAVVQKVNELLRQHDRYTDRGQSEAA